MKDWYNRMATRTAPRACAEPRSSQRIQAHQLLLQPGKRRPLGSGPRQHHEASNPGLAADMPQTPSEAITDHGSPKLAPYHQDQPRPFTDPADPKALALDPRRGLRVPPSGGPAARHHYTAIRRRPCRRLRLSTSRPEAVLIRRRKPCLLRRFLLLGWKVLFTVSSPRLGAPDSTEKTEKV